MKKITVGGIFVLLFLVSACAQEFKREPQEKVVSQYEEKILTENSLVEKEVVENDQENLQRVKELQEKTEATQEKKRTKEECEELWNQVKKVENPLLGLEARSVVVTFSRETSLEEARSLLKKYNVEEGKSIEIFPLSEEISDEVRFKSSSRMKGKVEMGKEINIACQILQEKEVLDAGPAITTDLAKLKELAQKHK